MFLTVHSDLHVHSYQGFCNASVVLQISTRTLAFCKEITYKRKPTWIKYMKSYILRGVHLCILFMISKVAVNCKGFPNWSYYLYYWCDCPPAISVLHVIIERKYFPCLVLTDRHLIVIKSITCWIAAGAHSGVKVRSEDIQHHPEQLSLGLGWWGGQNKKCFWLLWPTLLNFRL